MDAIAIAQPGGPEVIAATVRLRSSATPYDPRVLQVLTLQRRDIPPAPAGCVLIQVAARCRTVPPRHRFATDASPAE